MPFSNFSSLKTLTTINLTKASKWLIDSGKGHRKGVSDSTI